MNKPMGSMTSSATTLLFASERPSNYFRLLGFYPCCRSFRNQNHDVTQCYKGFTVGFAAITLTIHDAIKRRLALESELKTSARDQRATKSS